MKTKLTGIALFFTLLITASCSQDNTPLNKQEEKAVEAQIQADQAAQDSLEKAIEAQINAVDSPSVTQR